MSLPPMKALVAFEAAARLQNFTQAANELHLTHGAISRQIALLEQHFGLPLFVRLARGVSLTEVGVRLHQTVDEMLGKLSSLSRELRDKSATGNVNISVTPSFGAHWLLPRLRQFNASHPQILVQLNASLALADLDRAHYDFAVRDLPASPGPQAALLFRDTLTPVCRPDLVERIGALPLLHDTNFEHWRQWLRAIDRAELLAQCESSILNDYNLVIEAALNGIGIAIGRTELIADLLISGRLVAPFEMRVPSPRGHYRVKSSHALRKPAEVLWNWLRSASASQHEDQPGSSRRCRHVLQIAHT